jgi:hypothetical protein
MCLFSFIVNCCHYLFTQCISNDRTILDLSTLSGLLKQWEQEENAAITVSSLSTVPGTCNRSCYQCHHHRHFYVFLPRMSCYLFTPQQLETVSTVTLRPFSGSYDYVRPQPRRQLQACFFARYSTTTTTSSSSTSTTTVSPRSPRLRPRLADDGQAGYD